VPRGEAEVKQARENLHHAALLVGSVGHSLLEHRSDDSHTNMEWVRPAACLAGGILDEGSGLRAGLRPADFSLVVLKKGGVPLETFPLEGRTMKEGLAWFGEALGRALGAPLPRALELRAYEMPDHPLRHGAPFGIGNPAAAVAFGAWFDLADRVLGPIAAAHPKASPVRCWPHHFDIATLLEEGASPAGKARFLNAGMSPGDGSFAEPYWYVTPWPAPPAGAGGLPPLPGGGHWQTAGWVGAVLPASEASSGSFQAPGTAPAAAFLAGALPACRKILEAAGG